MRLIRVKDFSPNNNIKFKNLRDNFQYVVVYIFISYIALKCFFIQIFINVFVVRFKPMMQKCIKEDLFIAMILIVYKYLRQIPNPVRQYVIIRI